MKIWLILLTVAALGLGMFVLSCAGDDDDCDCDDDTADDDDADDDTSAADDDLLGVDPGAQQCLNELQAPFQACKEPCYIVLEEICEFYHCLYGCFATMFDSAVDCGEQYPELEPRIPYWQCNADCDRAYQTCMEPLDECDYGVNLECTDELFNCESGCVAE